jgi:hypothetical protein
MRVVRASLFLVSVIVLFACLHVLSISISFGSLCFVRISEVPRFLLPTFFVAVILFGRVSFCLGLEQPESRHVNSNIVYGGHWEQVPQLCNQVVRCFPVFVCRLVSNGLLARKMG